MCRLARDLCTEALNARLQVVDQSHTTNNKVSCGTTVECLSLSYSYTAEGLVQCAVIPVAPRMRLLLAKVDSISNDGGAFTSHALSVYKKQPDKGVLPFSQ